MDFQKERRIALTGSATPLVTEEQESGVGRWHTIRLATLREGLHRIVNNLPTSATPRPRVNQSQP